MPPAPPNQQAPPAPDGVILQRWSGLRNTVTGERLSPEELEAAVNVDIDDVGQIHRRRGYTKVASGDFGSLFTSDEGTVYGIKDGYLGIINPDYSFIGLAGNFTDDPLAYIQVGSQIYFSCRSRAGIIDQLSQSVIPWGSDPDYWFSPVVNPTANLPAIRGRLLGKPPLATALAYFNGRIYLANARTVWATELYLYNYVDKTRNFWNFEADVTMIGSVTDGLYVGTKEGVWFVSGSFAEAKRIRVMDSGVVPGSMIYVPAELANPPQVGLGADTPVKVSLMFMTRTGICGGQDSGICYNFTESKVIFPQAFSASSLFRRQDGVNSYVVVTDNGGTPATAARIGDYIDVSLVRRGDWGYLGESLGFGDSFAADVV